MRRKLAGIHHAQETFAVHDFADECQLSQRHSMRWRACC
jgi:hypothetical protein